MIEMSSRIVVICLALLSLVASQRIENQNCKNSQSWVCKKMRDCSWAIDLLRRGQNPELCGFEGNLPVVCCPVGDTNTPSPPTPPPTPPPTLSGTRPTQRTTRRPANGNKQTSISQIKCREYAQYVYELEKSPVLIVGSDQRNVSTCAIEAATLIVNGVTANPREFPHMALVGYGNDQNRISWLCGGSLISEDFVMSAAHCSDTAKGPASWVKLGELDQDSETEEASPIVVRIAERIDHPNYNKARTYHDLTLFRLERRVELNKYIRPLCLPDSRTLPLTALASGWGHTEYGGKPSKRLMKVLIHFVSHDACSAQYRTNRKQLPQGIQEKTQICAGDEGKDTCQGDSGGPLQITMEDPFCMYMQIGVTSFGRACAQGYPGVYTRLSHYVPWIEKIVWPNQ